MVKYIGPKIATGRTAEVFLWNDNQVIKLFQEGISVEMAGYEAKVASAVYNSKLPVPDVGEIVRIDNRVGLVFQRIKGISMLETFEKMPWKLIHFAHQLAELHFKVHSRIVPDLPSQLQRFKDKIRSVEVLSEDLKKKILLLLCEMPDDNCLCHGDFHPGNILLTTHGPIIIDWMDTTKGNPLADVARTSLLACEAFLPKDMPSRLLFLVTRRLIDRIYLKRYFKLNPKNREQFRIWLTINAAARLAENIIEEQDRLISLVQSGLLIHS